MNIVNTAKMLRRELADTFPKTKFSVRVDRYSLGEAINVFWVNGVSSNKVDMMLRKYEEISYDTISGEILSGGNRYVHGHRRVTEDIRKLEEEVYRQKYGSYNEYDYRDYTAVARKISSSDYEDGVSLNP